jgi:predicted DNA-binding transcriptional regulator AlpA
MTNVQSITTASPLPFRSGIMDSAQLAEFLTNKKNTIEGWRIKGIGPKYIKIGRLVRYRISDVEEWLESQVRSSTSQTA